MEPMYSKLYDKYRNLQAKFSELEKYNQEQSNKFMDYVSAAENIIDGIKKENTELQNRVNELMNQTPHKRSDSQEYAGKIAEYQTLLLEEYEKRKELTEELNKLKQVVESGVVGAETPPPNRLSAKNVNTTVRLLTGRKRVSLDRDPIHGDDEDSLAELVDVPTLNRDGPRAASGGRGHDLKNCDHSDCLYHTLLECLAGMAFSISEMNALELSVCHQSSGYSFSLTWVDKGGGDGDDEIIYKVSSLGTLSRVAPEWMREEILFTTSMCTVFFKRLGKVIGIQS